ncbi:MAG: ABC transporter ATP-binding protein [Rhodobacteraceae bacterium]|nr:ABC transporter ATP-binding protein [Paracoccaceae bacterium]
MSLLDLETVTLRHGLLTAVHGLSLSVNEGEVLSIIGANGAGKTTLLRAIAGVHPVAEGRIRFQGADITGWPGHARQRVGIAMSPEGRRLFPDMTVRENLQIAAEGARRKGDWTLPRVVEALPQIAPLLDRAAGGLSGGQRQAVAIGRALMANPALILLDEVSLGLSPVAVEGVYQSLAALKGRVTMVIVEQDLTRAMAFSSRLVCMAEGRVELDGRPAELSRDQITQAYFGLHKEGTQDA